MKMNMKKIITFLIINFALSLIPYYVIISGTMTVFTNLGLMWIPAVSAIITQLIFNKSIKGFGWGGGKVKYLAISFMIPLVSCLIVYGIVWVTKLGGVSWMRLTEQYNAPISKVIINISTILFLFNLFGALGEEIGWRGFLTAELLKGYSYIKTSLVLAVIWFIWHCPIIIFSSYHNQSTPLWYNLIFVFIAVIASTFITVWIKIQSGSLWTAAVFHASHNLLIQQVFDVMTVDTGKTKYFTSEFGIGIALIYSIGASYCIIKSRRCAKHQIQDSYTA